MATTPIELNEKDNERSLDVELKQVVQLKLASKPTAGYNWYLKPVPSSISVEKSFVKSGGACGAGGTTVFRLTPSEAGTFPIKFVYKHKSEDDEAAIKSFSIKLMVK